jgi:hypothetical protein
MRVRITMELQEILIYWARALFSAVTSLWASTARLDPCRWIPRTRIASIAIVQEVALDEIGYTNRVVSLTYSAREEARVVYENGLALQRSLQLDSVKTAVDGKLTHQYEFAYQQSITTKRTLLASIEECVDTGECKAPTGFEYADVRTGFDELATDIAMPLFDVSASFRRSKT